MDREPIAQMVNSLRLTIDELVVLVNRDETRAEVFAEQVALCTAWGRLGLILSAIEARHANHLRKIRT